jgi:hypothetical protein
MAGKPRLIGCLGVAESVVRTEDCACELGCDNTVYEVEKLLDKKWVRVRSPMPPAVGWVGKSFASPVNMKRPELIACCL